MPRHARVAAPDVVGASSPVAARSAAAPASGAEGQSEGRVPDRAVGRPTGARLRVGARVPIPGEARAVLREEPLGVADRLGVQGRRNHGSQHVDPMAIARGGMPFGIDPSEKSAAIGVPRIAGPVRPIPAARLGDPEVEGRSGRRRLEPREPRFHRATRTASPALSPSRRNRWRGSIARRWTCPPRCRPELWGRAPMPR
jgi:hypothetical protein